MKRLLLALPLVLSTALAGAGDYPLETLYRGPMALPWSEGLETLEFTTLKGLGSSGLWSQLPQPLRQQISRDEDGRYMLSNKVGAVSSPDRAVEIASLRFEDGRLTVRYRVASQPQKGVANVHLIVLPVRAKIRFVKETSSPAPTGGLVAALGGDQRLTVCHRFDCQDTVQVSLPAEALARLRSHFSPLPADATKERARVATALALIEREVGPLAGTGDDKGGWAGNRTGGSRPGSQDCLDESSNTTGYLGLLVREGLLRFHRPEATVSRGPITHYSTTMRDLATDQVWVVDTWFRDNGQPAVIQTLRDWKKKKEKNLPPLGE